MKAKSIPLRKCTGCQEMKDKRTLVRVVKNEDEFSIDFTGKKPGRGAYICSDLDVLVNNPGAIKVYEKLGEELLNAGKQ